MIDKTKLSAPNDMGYQFGINKSLTEYAHKGQANSGNALPPVDITVLEVWKDDKLVTFLLVDEKTNNEIQDCNGFEAAAVALDKFKLLKKMEEKK